MIVGFTHDSNTLWRIWDPELQKLKARSEVVFDKERNAHMPCQHGNNTIDTDMFALPEGKENIQDTDSGDEPLRR